MIRASGSETGSRERIGHSSIRQNEVTGAPARSEPKVGKAWAVLAVLEGGYREHLRCGDDSLAATSVYPDLEHQAAALAAASSLSSLIELSIPSLRTSTSRQESRSTLRQKYRVPS